MMRALLSTLLKENPFLYQSAYLPYMRLRMSLGLEPAWVRRIACTVSCPDNARIPRVRDAGITRRGIQLMHNGLRVYSQSYYGYMMNRLMQENRGVHEPQEELVFGNVLPHIRPGSTMLELGSYWAFYSMWFRRDVPDSRCICVEPVAHNLRMGRRNFSLNSLDAIFERGYVGTRKSTAPDGVPVFAVDEICERHNVKQLGILHADVQGAELEALQGAREMLANERIDYCFISTHGNDLHDAVRRTLLEYGHRVIADANCDESFSEDGVFVTSRGSLNDCGPISISLRARP